MKNLLAYTVELFDENEDKRINYVRWSTYDKKVITKTFADFCNVSKDGQVINYWKQDNKYAYNPLLTVENHKGQLKKLIIKGEKCFYKSFDVVKFLNTIK
jgi:hypothetical protein